ncbi:MAG: hypothetical protein JSS53_00245 [Proteobacteria bacterium]|nr:hypothetical protein [Pseudomonadota bacterium]
MSSFDLSSKTLLVFSELLNDLPALKKRVEYYKNFVGLTDVWLTRRAQILIVKPHFPSYSLCVNSVSALADCYEKQAAQLASYLYLELGFIHQQIHVESGSLEKLVKKYIQQYEIEKVIFDLVPFGNNCSLPNVERMNQNDYFEKQGLGSLMSLYGS